MPMKCDVQPRPGGHAGRGGTGGRGGDGGDGGPGGNVFLVGTTSVIDEYERYLVVNPGGKQGLNGNGGGGGAPGKPGAPAPYVPGCGAASGGMVNRFGEPGEENKSVPKEGAHGVIKMIEIGSLADI